MRWKVWASAAVLMGVAVGGVIYGGVPPKIELQAQRSSPQDLEVTGDVPGVPAGGSHFLRYADLAALPQVSYTVRDDLNFNEPVKVSGVPLDLLLQAMGLKSGKVLVAAICGDGYEGHYTAEYRAQHHPVLVLKLNGQEPAQWARGPDGELYPPYFIENPAFKPNFKVLAQPEMAQAPINVTKLRFYDEDATLAGLKPPASAPPEAMQGYRIVLQNCLRCHRAGDIGGTKSPFGWPQLALIAQGNATAFGKYVVQPTRVNPEATMPANLNYDPATVAALTAYFASAKQQ